LNRTVRRLGRREKISKVILKWSVDAKKVSVGCLKWLKSCFNS
jgi:hypothetical protein